ncbi:MAG: CBS domain-containing protein [Stellaceae bacterium]
MKARDIMTGKVVSVRPDTPASDIARLLLENHISAVPVLDRSGAAIGMVSEGDLIGRDESDRQARRDWWLSLLAEGEPLSPEFLAGLRRPEHTAGDIMSRPVVTVGEDTDTGEIARLLQAYRIKRVPVLRDGQVVGIVSRENLLRALSEERPHDDAKPRTGPLAGAFAALDRHFEHPRHGSEPRAAPMPAAEEVRLNVADFRRLVADYENKEVHHREEQRRIAAEQHRRQTAELIDRHVSDTGWRNLLHEARLAAEHGAKEFMLLRFPSEACSDGGRAVNAGEPDWPARLRGDAAELYLRWERDLKPQGFHLAARVLDFPGGMPGDIGIFLGWPQ